MPHTPKAFAAACALTLSFALTPAALGTPTAHADTATTVIRSADETPGAETPGTEAQGTAKPKPPNGYGLRLTTFNILSSSIARGGVDRATRAARWVQDQGADAAAFQEVAKD